MNKRLLLLALTLLSVSTAAKESENVLNTSSQPSIIGNWSCLSSVEEQIEDGPIVVDRHRMVFQFTEQGVYSLNDMNTGKDKKTKELLYKTHSQEVGNYQYDGVKKILAYQPSELTVKANQGPEFMQELAEGLFSFRKDWVAGLKISDLSSHKMTYQPDELIANTYQCKRLKD
jgi:hypothetical protein